MPDPQSDPLVVWIGALTDTGKVRRHNEDYVGYHVPEDRGANASYGALTVVCDGVGGGAAGEVASERSVHRILSDYYAGAIEQTPEERLRDAIQQANAELYAENQHSPDDRPMSTTVVAALLLDRELLVAHAGDSRAYLVRDNQIAQITRDHSWVAEMVEAGDLTSEEAEHHPWRNRITRGLGLAEMIKLDVQQAPLKSGDSLVLCSDGLTRHVSDAEILDAVARFSPDRAVHHLIRLANMRGGKDNVSVLIAEALTEEERITRLNQAEFADEETQAPAQPRRNFDRRRAVLLAVGAAFLLLLCIAAAGLWQGGATAPAAPPTATPPARAPSEATVPRWIVNDAAGLRVRNGPSRGAMEATGIPPLKKGEEMTVLAWTEWPDCQPDEACEHCIWLEIALPAPIDRGWVCGDFVKLLAKESLANSADLLRSVGLPTVLPPTLTPTASASPSPTPTLTHSPSPTRTPTHTRTPTGSPTAPPTTPSHTPTAKPTNMATPNRFTPGNPTAGATGRFSVIGASNGASVTAQATLTIPIDPGASPVAAFLSDSSGLAIVSGQQLQIYKFVTTTGELLLAQPMTATLPANRHIEALAGALGGNVLLAVDDAVMLWDLRAQMEQTLWNPEFAGLSSLAVAPRGDWLAIGTANGAVGLAKLGESGVISRTRLAGEDGSKVTGLSFSRDDRLVAALETTGRVRIWRTEGGSGPGELQQPAGRAIAFAPNDSENAYLFASSSDDGRLSLWDVKPRPVPSFSRNSRPPPQQLPGRLRSFAFTLDGSALALGLDDGTVWLGSIQKGVLIQPSGLTGRANVISFSPDGTLLLAVSDDGHLVLWGVRQ